MSYISTSQSNFSASSINTSLLETTSTDQVSLNDTSIRRLAGQLTSNSVISFNNLRGKDSYQTPTLGTQYACTSSAIAILTRINSVISNNLNSYYYLTSLPLGGYSDYLYLGSTVFDFNSSSSSTLLNSSSCYYSSYPISRFVIPTGCASITIQAWGGGGGSGGSYTTQATPGSGGAGGYATTTLTVGTNVFIGQVLHCIVGWGGAGAINTFRGGSAGFASAVYVTDGSYGYPTSNDANDWVINFLSYMNVNNCVLIAGGGGGGGGVNWSSSTGGSGGSGGSADSGTGGSAYSGSGTGATITAHGGGNITTVAASVAGNVGGGLLPTENANSLNDFASEATIFALCPCINGIVDSGDTTRGAYILRSMGGGGAFQGNVGHIGYEGGSANSTNRGGGGGSNKVYKGSGSTSTSNISSTPPNASGGYGYGGVGRGSADINNSNYYAGVSGTSGRILITFNG